MVRLLQNRFFLFSILFLLSFLFMALQANYFMPFLADDSLISLRYADRLLHGQGLTWTTGHPVEGYSNLLWVLLTAFLGKMGLDLIFGARILGVLCMAGVLFLTLNHTMKHPSTTLPSALIVVSLAGLSGLTAVWAIGGMEQPLLALLLSGVVFNLFQWVEEQENVAKLWVASFLLGLLCLTRPDAPLFTVAAGLAMPILAQKARLRIILVLISFPMLCYGGQLLFRLQYYGEWVPNTALVKIAPSWMHWAKGLYYVGTGVVRGMSLLSVLAILSLIECFRNPQSRKKRYSWLSYWVFGCLM